MADTFDDYLKSFTESTLTIINSGHQIRDAINGTTAQAPAPTRQDNPIESKGVPLWVWILGAVIVYKKVLQ